MKSFRIPLVKVIGLLALAMLLVAGCAETPEDPAANSAPDTFISTFNIEIAPDSSTFYFATINWRGSDKDGEAVSYRYWVGSDEPTFTFETSARVRLNFPVASTSYDFFVQAQDNSGTWDETAASIVLSISAIRDVGSEEFIPETFAISVPPNGSATSRGVPFILGGSDVDGIVSNFEWAVDGGDWTSIIPDVITVSSSSVTAVLGPDDLSFGAHTVFFRAVDNNGIADPSPISVSIDCVDGFAPEMSMSVANGQVFNVPFTQPEMEELEISFSTLVDFYYGMMEYFVVSTSNGNVDTTLDASYTFMNASAGDYWISVMAFDVAGNSVSDSAAFNINVVEADQGVLCINGVDWGTYGGQIEDLWTNGVPWGERTNFKTWDLFDSSPIYSGSDFGDSLLGVGAIPDWLISTTFFTAIVWIGNNYAGDFAYWEDNEDNIMAYLNDGGNVLLPPRLGHYWFFDELAEYCALDNDSWRIGIGADELQPIHPSFAPITAASGQSLWEIPDVDLGANNVWIYEAPNVAPGGHAGFITLPNGEGGGGAFCYIAGRPYRWTNADLKAAFDVVLTQFFGVN